MSLSDRVLARLAQCPMSRSVLYERMSDVGTMKKLAYALYALKRDGKIVIGDGGVYQLADNAKRIVSLMSGVKPATAAPTSIPPMPNMSVKTSKDIETRLEQLLTEAQGTLDAYLYDLGDQRILSPLVATRNGARLALEAYRLKKISRMMGGPA